MNLNYIRSNLDEIYFQSSNRGLRQSAKWAAELLCSIKSGTEVNSRCLDDSGMNSTFDHPMEELKERKTMDPHNNYDYRFAKSIFDLGEYERCAFFTQKYTDTETCFLHFYSKYLAIEKRRLDKMVEPSSVIPQCQLKIFLQLRTELEELFLNNMEIKEDCYMHYLHGIVLLKLGLDDEAIAALTKSVGFDPLCWCSWQQLSQIIEDETQFSKLKLPNHWLKNFFIASVYLELQLNENALSIYTDLLNTFVDNNYLRSQLAKVKYNLREVEQAIVLFGNIRSEDPYRLDSMDIYSNLLYVKEMQNELSSLAHVANQIDPFRVETCYCIANFFSLRGQHAKSVVYFSRALQLNPKHLSAWTLMGHEYVELKNTNAAIQAYRSAIKCNKRDFRAWYGLGQTYEILKMPAYSLYYYGMAHFLKPNDSRLITAIGQTYEKLSRYEDAANCYAKSGFSSLIRLALLYEKMDEEHKAAAVYNEYVNHFEEKQLAYNLATSDLTLAYKFLANYFFKNNKFQQAQTAAQMCMCFNETRDEAKELLNKIQAELDKNKCD
ncbi:Anaphase-promoting complex subunit 23 [Blomia tropicalis]|nr:Anaphase-promoting complex subunit 23 [Blomia tropicalis]